METAERLNNSGIALTEAGRPWDAIPLFQSALRMEPENSLLWLNLGIARQKTGEYEEAAESYQMAICIDEGLSEAWGSLGLVHYELGQFDSAKECYRAAISRNKEDYKVWNNLGVLYFAQYRYEDARGCFEKALSIMPMFCDSLFNLRDACRELSDYSAAAEAERILSLYKSDKPPDFKYAMQSKTGFPL